MTITINSKGDGEMLILSRRPNESVMIGDDIQIIVLGVKGNQVRLGCKVPKHIPVHREEIYERIKAEGRQIGGQSA